MHRRNHHREHVLDAFQLDAVARAGRVEDVQEPPPRRRSHHRQPPRTLPGVRHGVALAHVVPAEVVARLRGEAARARDGARLVRTRAAAAEASAAEDAASPARPEDRRDARFPTCEACCARGGGGIGPGTRPAGMDGERARTRGSVQPGARACLCARRGPRARGRFPGCPPRRARARASTVPRATRWRASRLSSGRRAATRPRRRAVDRSPRRRSTARMHRSTRAERTGGRLAKRGGDEVRRASAMTSHSAVNNESTTSEKDALVTFFTVLCSGIARVSRVRRAAARDRSPYRASSCAAATSSRECSDARLRLERHTNIRRVAPPRRKPVDLGSCERRDAQADRRGGSAPGTRPRTAKRSRRACWRARGSSGAGAPRTGRGDRGWETFAGAVTDASDVRETRAF